MNLEQMSARIAPRNAWQAIDLGARLYQTWWKPLTLIWLLFSLPLLLILLGLFWQDYPGAVFLLIWWLKPALERPLLEYCGRALFSQPASPVQLLRQWRGYGWRGLLPWLLWRRISFSRSFLMPVTQLEQQFGQAFRQRRQALNSGPANRSVTLTVLMLHIEQLFSYVLVILLMMLMPAQLGISEVEWMLDDNMTLLALLGWYAVLCVTQPLYVCSGFALYLNKRTWLEGWDMELGLRRIGERRTLAQQRIGPTLVLLCLLPLTLILPSGNASANTADSARDDAIAIVAGEEFMPLQVTERWQWKAQDARMEQAGDDLLLRIMRWLFERDVSATPRESHWSLAGLLRALLWVLVISAVLYGLWHYRRWLASLPARWRPAPPPVTHIGGLDIRPESLPDDIAADVMEHIHSGDLRQAVSLLYRATLSRLASDGQMLLLPGATEQEALQHCRDQHQDRAGVALLATITPLWISTAWAHRPPAADSLRTLVQHWSDHFDRRSRTEPSS
ncbi:MAG: DUF4129 domain-containing protein [Alcanivoracaceae bacterium]